MSFEITSEEVVETTLVHLVNANDEKLFTEDGEAVSVEVYGKASKQYRQALSALSRKNVLRKGKTQSFETNVEDNIDLLVAVSKTSHNLKMVGVDVTTAEQFKALYSNPKLFFIKDAIQTAIEDNANFTKK